MPVVVLLGFVGVAACTHSAEECTVGASLLIGALFGLALYAVNLYGFAVVFPWFAQVRDWITITAHLVFGLTAAGVYRSLERR